MMEHPIVIVTVQNQPVVNSPAIGVDGGAFLQGFFPELQASNPLWNNEEQPSQTPCLPV
jgi:hypothetical protein